MALPIDTGFLAGVGSTIKISIEISILLAVFGTIAWFIIWNRKFNISVEIFADRAGFIPQLSENPEINSTDTPSKPFLPYYKIFYEKAALIQSKRGYDVIRLKKGAWSIKTRKDIKAPAPYYLYPTNKGNKLYLKQVAYNEYVPLLLGDVKDMQSGSVLEFKSTEQDIAYWAAQQQLAGRLTYGKKTWFEQYGNIMVFGIFAIMIVVLLYVVLKKFDVLAQVAASLDHTAQVMRGMGQVPVAPSDMI
jgi:hypothetical protein